MTSVIQNIVGLIAARSAREKIITKYILATSAYFEYGLTIPVLYDGFIAALKHDAAIRKLI